ncbi:MAG: helix-turn-helix domain-containing protein [Deltaproteobacteria bacterium]|nr:helix-turn-helix domain-containing protein [Deltaproteobacteria bacterium]
MSPPRFTDRTAAEPSAPAGDPTGTGPDEAGVVPFAGPRLYTLAEAARILRCSTDTIMRRIATGRLRCFRDGRKVLFSDNHITDYLGSIETGGSTTWGACTSARASARRPTTGRSGSTPRAGSGGRPRGVVTAEELRRSCIGRSGRPRPVLPSNGEPPSST